MARTYKAEVFRRASPKDEPPVVVLTDDSKAEVDRLVREGGYRGAGYYVRFSSEPKFLPPLYRGPVSPSFAIDDFDGLPSTPPGYIDVRAEEAKGGTLEVTRATHEIVTVSMEPPTRRKGLHLVLDDAERQAAEETLAANNGVVVYVSRAEAKAFTEAGDPDEELPIYAGWFTFIRDGDRFTDGVGEYPNRDTALRHFHKIYTELALDEAAAAPS